MSVSTINALTEDERVKLEFAKRVRAANLADLENDTKYAVVLLKLGESVVPGDYAALRAAIVGIAGIQDVDLLIDHQTRSTIPVNHTQVIRITADVGLRDDTPEPPE